ncbi:heme-binding protein [Methylobacillus gramineus]|uniref:GlcG/HbpS family heme-binding protein n=1 Tax=Methylobacillus gramineus TaxID=755169 RepID=UPI001CFF5A04|nr:heme-binding protein [Methylobacillus gramineus]MCB5186151.1 heme-binding protein [Methylobacillus gramineus]
MPKIAKSALLVSLLALSTTFAQAAPILYGAPISNEDAKKVGSAAAAAAKKRNIPVVVAVVDSTGTLAYFEKLDGTQISSADTGIGKARTANNWKRPSKDLEDVVVKNHRTALLNLPNIVPVQGGLPIVRDGKIIGAIGASGGTGQEDEEISQAGIDALNK